MASSTNQPTTPATQVTPRPGGAIELGHGGHQTRSRASGAGTRAGELSSWRPQCPVRLDRQEICRPHPTIFKFEGLEHARWPEDSAHARIEQHLSFRIARQRGEQSLPLPGMSRSIEHSRRQHGRTTAVARPTQESRRPGTRPHRCGPTGTNGSVASAGYEPAAPVA
jgi:hypothetical protein